MDCQADQRLEMLVMKRVILVCKEIQRDHQQIPKEVCDSTGWPEGAKAMQEEQESRFCCSNCWRLPRQRLSFGNFWHKFSLHLATAGGIIKTSSLISMIIMLFSYLKNELNLKFKQISNISLSLYIFKSYSYFLFSF